MGSEVTSTRNKTSGIKGVSLDKRSNSWFAYTKIKVKGKAKQIHLGSFSTKEAAARARQRADEVYAYMSEKKWQHENQ